MTAQEIVNKVNGGETVSIPTRFVGVFMQECERHQIQCDVKMQARGKETQLSRGSTPTKGDVSRFDSGAVGQRGRSL